MRSERFTTTSEVKSILEKNSDKAGVCLFYEDNNFYTHTSEGNVLTIGVPGSGKSSTFTYTTAHNIIKAKESFFVIDPKREVFNRTYSLAKKTHDVYVLNFRNPSKSHSINILKEIYLLYKSSDPDERLRGIELLNEFAMTLYPDSPEQVDPFWMNSCRSLMIGASLALFDTAPKEQINLESVYNFVVNGEKRVGTNKAIDEFVEMLPPDCLARRELTSYVNSPRDTRMSIFAVWTNGFREIIQSDEIINLLCLDGGFNIYNITGDKPVAVYIVLPDEHSIYRKITSILISMITTHYIRLAEDRYNSYLPIRTHILIEELANIGPISNLPHLLSASRSRNIRLYAVIQAYSQLDAVYGKQAEAIKDCFDITIAFRIHNYQTLEELSRRCGQKYRTMKNYHISEPLLQPSEIGAFNTRQCLVLISGRYKYVTSLPFFGEVVDYDRNIPQLKPNVRSKRPTPFDIVAVVEKHRREKIEDILNIKPKPSHFRFPAMVGKDENELATETTIKKVNEMDQEAQKRYVNALCSRIDEKLEALEAMESSPNFNNESDDTRFNEFMKDFFNNLNEDTKDDTNNCS